jgi:hypothetical protein
VRTVANWIFDENLPVFLVTLGYIVGYQFDPAEVEVIEAGVRESDGDADYWFGYSLPGSVCACDLQLAQDYGSSVIHVRLSLPELQGAQAEVAVYMCQCFYLRAEAEPLYGPNSQERAPRKVSDC